MGKPDQDEMPDQARDEAAAHHVHGMGAEWEAPRWPAITRDEAAAVLALYEGTGVLESLLWHSPRPFSAATLAQTDRGRFLIKRQSPAIRTPAALAQEHAFIAHLRQAGLGVPDVLTTADGKSALAYPTPCGTPWTYEVHRQARGVDLYRERQSWTAYLSTDHAFASGAALGRFHKAAPGFAEAQAAVPMERAAQPLVASFVILPAIDSMAMAQTYVAARPALNAYLAPKPWIDDLARIFALWDIAELAPRLRQEPVLWTHNDWHPSNVLWDSDASVGAHVATIIDFGLSAPTCALHDLALAIERAMIPWLEMTPEHDQLAPDEAAAHALLAGYHSEVPLTAERLDLLVRLLPLVHLEFALSEADYFMGVLGDVTQADLAWHGYALGHADWFASPEGLTFLNALRRSLTFA